MIRTKKTREETETEAARDKLWEMGILDWKLSDPQRIIKKGILEDATKVSVVMCARRLGKTYLMLTMAVEVCIKTPGAVVKYAFPKQKAAKKNIVPNMKKILSDCPRHLLPVFMTAELCYRFPNGSEIQMAGTDNGNIENIRGGDSWLNIVDEAGFCTDLTYGVRSVLGPTVKLTKGRTILVSTPSRKENHEFIQDWVLPYQAENRIKVFSIFDNPQFTDAIIKDALDDYPGGESDPGFRREYMCEIIRDAEKTILPSFSNQVEREIVTDQFEFPVFCDRYVSLDPGGKDLTGVLFGYYDYLEATLVIIDEIAVDGATNSAILADMIREKEKLHWTNPIDKSLIAPYMRVSDVNNAILLTDLQKLHNLSFSKTKKDKKQAAVNALDVAIMQRKVIIHPRCENLLYHMKYAEWNNTQTEFKHLKASPSGKLKASHCDLLDCLIYMHRSVVKSHNPFPRDYNDIRGSSVFKGLRTPEKSHNALGDALSKLFKKNKKK